MIASVPLRQTVKALVFLAPALGFAACSQEADGGKLDGETPMGEHQLVYSVDEVDIAVMESMPLQVRISARGQTRTGGWTDAQLVLDEEASEGVNLVYRFVAVRPTGMATQAFTPIEASITYGPWVDRAGRVIQVVASSNTHEVVYPFAEGE